MKNSYRKGYVYDCRTINGSIEILIGIPYPNNKWFNYIEKRAGAIDALFREFGISVTRNPLIDCNNLSIYLRSYEYTVVRLSKPVGEKLSTYYIKFIGHEAIPKYPLETSDITWSAKQAAVPISKSDAIKFLEKSKLAPILKKLIPIKKFSDIPRDYTMVHIVVENEWEHYAPIIEAVYGTRRIMVPELYVRNNFDIPEEKLQAVKRKIRERASEELADDDGFSSLEKFIDS